MDGRDNDIEDGLPGPLMDQPKMAKSRKMTYKKMIAEAIQSMKERRGSSRQAIAKYINNNYALSRGSSTRINTMLNKMVQRRDLIQTRGSGATGSFKINSNVVPFVSAGKKKGKSRSRRRRKGRKGKKKKGRRTRRKRRRGGKKARRGKKRRGGKRRGGRRRKAKRTKRRARKMRGGRRRSSAPTSIPTNLADM